MIETEEDFIGEVFKDLYVTNKKIFSIFKIRNKVINISLNLNYQKFVSACHRKIVCDDLFHAANSRKMFQY